VRSCYDLPTSFRIHIARGELLCHDTILRGQIIDSLHAYIATYLTLRMAGIYIHI